MSTQRIGLAIDQVTNDLGLDDAGNLSMATNAEAVGQHVRQRLGTFKGEWFLDTEAGVPWLDEILGRQVDLSLAEAVMKKEIMETEGVTEITSFSISSARSVRSINASRISVMTDYDQEASI